MKKKVTVLGAGGQMGQWFTKYFAGKNFEVTGYDSENKVLGKDIIVSDSLVGGILKADYVVLCTPTRRTPEVIRLIAKEMKRGTYLIEISSEKSKVASSLAKMPAKINPIVTKFAPSNNDFATVNSLLASLIGTEIMF